MATKTAEIRAGMWLEGYQAQAQAPVDFIRSERTRYLDVDGEDHGVAVKGAWSDPWWLYSPERGWAIAKCWRSKTQDVFVWRGQTSGHVHVDAITEYIVESWEGTE